MTNQKYNPDNKWCPFARVERNSNSRPVAINREMLSSAFPIGCECLGPKCACWVSMGPNEAGEALGRCGLANF